MLTPADFRQGQPGDETAPISADELDRVFAALYERIRRLASRLRFTNAGSSLSTGTLVHEAYLKLRKKPQALGEKTYDEAIRVFATAMHQILIDGSRREKALKRQQVEPAQCHPVPVEHVLTLLEGLKQLDREEPRQAQIIRSRFLLSLTTAETSAALGVPERTVERDLKEAKERLAEIMGAKK